MLRAVAALVEPRGDITHIFGGHFSWHLFRALGRRPILLTAVSAHDGGGPLPRRHLARVAVEIDSGVDDWVRAGVPRDRIAVVRPGIDLDWFTWAPPPASPRFTLLFASTPSDPAEIDARGIGLLVELARSRPDCDAGRALATMGRCRRQARHRGAGSSAELHRASRSKSTTCASTTRRVMPPCSGLRPAGKRAAEFRGRKGLPPGGRA